MAWFYNKKQVYGAWTDGAGVDHPADWDETWTDEEKLAKGLTQKGEINYRFFHGHPTEAKKDVAQILAEEPVRMQGILAHILGNTHQQVIAESDGEALVEIPADIKSRRAEAEASCASAIASIEAETTFDGLYALMMGSTKLVFGMHVPADSGNWGLSGTDDLTTAIISPEPPIGVTSVKERVGSG
jgi:hypothetical protein